MIIKNCPGVRLGNYGEPKYHLIDEMMNLTVRCVFLGNPMNQCSFSARFYFALNYLMNQVHPLIAKPDLTETIFKWQLFKCILFNMPNVK